MKGVGYGGYRCALNQLRYNTSTIHIQLCPFDSSYGLRLHAMGFTIVGSVQVLTNIQDSRMNTIGKVELVNDLW